MKPTLTIFSPRDYLFLFITYSGISHSKLLIWLILQAFYYLIRTAFSGMRTCAGAYNLLGTFYVAIPLSFLWLVRAQFGFQWSMFGLVVTWLTDTGAFFRRDQVRQAQTHAGGQSQKKRKKAP